MGVLSSSPGDCDSRGRRDFAHGLEWVVDFGGFFTKDSGAVGGFRCDDASDPGKCARGAKQFPGSAVKASDYGIAIEQAAGTSMLWRFAPTQAEDGGGGDD
jgi:hypothetical protein